jgi:hypothetical protein
MLLRLNDVPERLERNLTGDRRPAAGDRRPEVDHQRETASMRGAGGALGNALRASISSRNRA